MLQYWIALLLCIFYNGASEALCTARGRYPNNIQSDCRGYTMCLTGASGLINYDVICPEHSIYSHIDRQCTNVTSYQCLQNYTCSQEGDIPYKDNPNCELYVSCVTDLNNITTARLIECPIDQVFSHLQNVCVNRSEFACNFNRDVPNVLQISVDIPEVHGNISISSAISINEKCLIFITMTPIFLIKMY